MRQEREPAGKGELLTCEIQIFWAEDGQELYTLTTACYRPDEEGGGL